MTVYAQAQRVGEDLEIEAISNSYLPSAARLGDAEVAAMCRLGWSAPEAPDAPNFTRTAAEGADLHRLAVAIACTFWEVYAVRGDETWTVNPPEFAHLAAGLDPFEVLDPVEVKGGDPLCVLREGSGVALAVVVASDAVTFNDCLAAGLPRGDRIAEMAMLYRQDCSVEFLRASSFHLNVLRDPQPPLTTARALLAARPRAYEISKLNRRADVPHEALVRAAIRGYRQARARGESGGDYLRLDCVPPQRLTEVAAQQDGEAMGMLRHSQCPEDVVLCYLLARSARVRYAALAATRRRNLVVDSALLRAAGHLPMTDREVYPCADRVRTFAGQILATH